VLLMPRPGSSPAQSARDIRLAQRATERSSRPNTASRPSTAASRISDLTTSFRNISRPASSAFVKPTRSTGYFEPGVAPLQGNPNPWRIKKAPGDDGKRLKNDNILTYIPPPGTVSPVQNSQFTTSIQSYVGVGGREVGVVIPIAQDDRARPVECIDPLTHNYKYMTSLARNSNYRPQKDEYNHSVHFGRTKGYFGGFVDDVLKGVNQQDSVPGAVTWKSAMNAEFNRTASGMVKPSSANRPNGTLH